MGRRRTRSPPLRSASTPPSSAWNRSRSEGGGSRSAESKEAVGEEEALAGSGVEPRGLWCRRYMARAGSKASGGSRGQVWPLELAIRAPRERWGAGRSHSRGRSSELVRPGEGQDGQESRRHTVSGGRSWVGEGREELASQSSISVRFHLRGRHPKHQRPQKITAADTGWKDRGVGSRWDDVAVERESRPW